MIDLEHIRVGRGLPCHGEHVGSTGVDRVGHLGEVGHIGDDQVEADLLEGVGREGQSHEGGVVALAAAADHDFSVHAAAGGSSGDLAVSDGVAGSLEVAESGLLGGGVLVVGAHTFGVDVVAVDVNGEGDLVALIGNARSGPGGVGDGVVDDVGELTVVGVDSDIAVNGDNRGDGLTQILGGLITAVAVADLHAVGVEADIAVAEVGDEVGLDGIAGDLAVRVGFLDLLGSFLGVGGVSYVDRAGDNAGDLIFILHLAPDDSVDLGLALPVGRVLLQGDGAVGPALEGVRAGADRRGGHGLDVGQIALDKAEHVVVVVILVSLAIVVHGAHGDGELIDGGGVDLGEGDGHGVVTGLDDTGNVGSGLAGLDGDGIVVVGVAQLSLEEGGDAGAGGLSVDTVIGDVVAVLSNDGSPEVFDGRVIGELEAPVASLRGDGVVSGGVTGGDHVVKDLLGELRAGGAEGGPVSVVLLFGVEVVGGVGVRTGGEDQVLHSLHTAAIGFQTLDGQGVQRGNAVISGVKQDIVREDDIVDGHFLTVGELDALFQGDVVVDRAVAVFNDVAVGNALVSIVGAVVGTDVALDALEDDRALAVDEKQNVEDHTHDLVFIVIGIEEGGELTVEVLRADNKRLAVGLAVVRLLVAAAGQKTKTHDQRKDQCKCSFH